MEPSPHAATSGAQDAALPATAQRPGVRRYGEAILVALLLLSFIVRGALTARALSATFDEPPHVSSGYTHLTLGDFRMEYPHPPLLKDLLAAPLLFFHVNVPLDDPSWENARQWDFAYQFFYKYNHNSVEFLFWSRMTIVLVSALLGFFVYRWARELYGWKASILALALYVFEPNILAHSSLATNDLGVAAFMFIAAYLFSRFLKRPGLAQLAWAGALTGVAVMSKFSALILLPVFALLLIVQAARPALALPAWRLPGLARLSASGLRSRLYVAAASFAGLLAVTALVVWASYYFHVDPLVSQKEQLVKLDAVLATRVAPPLRQDIVAFAESVPLPASVFFKGNLYVLGKMREEMTQSFLLGQYAARFPHYFLVAFLLKASLPLLLLLAVAAYLLVRRPRRDEENHMLVIVAVVFLATSLYAINIGVRHLLPVYPFLIVLASKVSTIRLSRPALLNVPLTTLVLWQLGAATAVHPYYLSYFNELAGGPDNGYKALVDSNVDWGQGLNDLRRYMQEKGVSKVRLLYFGTADPAAYGVAYEPVSRAELYDPPPGVYALSVTSLQMLSRDPSIRRVWQETYQPVARPAHAIFVYDVPAKAPATGKP